MNQDPRSRILRLVDTVTLRASDLAAFPDSDALLTARGEIRREGDVLSRGAK